ncbi:MAG TPA: ABC transporter substrate-binding protein [Acetobacteraceae bacterium]
MNALRTHGLVMDRRAILRLSAAAVVAGASLRPGRPAAAATDPMAPIQQLNAALLAAMKAGQQAGFARRYAILAPAVEQAIDLDTILRASVGLRWATMGEQEKTGLSATFIRYTVSTYAANFDSFSGQSFRILPDTRSLSNGDMIVHTQIVRADRTATPIDYVMRQTPTGWKAVDVLADGAISRVAVQRSDFRALLDRGGVPALEAGLMHKVASLSGGMAA